MAEYLIVDPSRSAMRFFLLSFTLMVSPLLLAADAGIQQMEESSARNVHYGWLGTQSIFRAIADCGPTRGPAPHTVRFHSRGVFTDGSIVRYRWDVEGDGEFDTDSKAANDFTHTYPRPGTFEAVLEVTNNFEETATDTCTIQVEESPPTATAKATPSNGQVPLVVDFTCMGEDPDGEIALYEWDFEGDGIFDTRNTTYTSSPVVLTSLQTVEGLNTAGTRVRQRTASGFEVKVEEEQSDDSETAHTEEQIGYLVTAPGKIHDAEGKLIGEAGIIETDQPDESTWHTVDLENRYTKKLVVVMQIMTYRGKHPSHTRIRNVGQSSFEFQIEEWEYLDQSHTGEEIGYLILEQGRHRLADGTTIEVGSVETDHNWATVDFAEDFLGTPVVVSHPQTTRGGVAVVTRHRNTTGGGMELRLQAEEAGGTPSREVIGYIAALPVSMSDFGAIGRTPISVTHAWSRIDLKNPSDKVNHTYTETGTFAAVCRVTDDDELTAEAGTTETVIHTGPPGTPSIEVTASPPSGSTPLKVSFEGNANDEGTIVLWEWDFDGDEEFDFSSPDTPATTHEYTAGGIYAATLRATDEEGLTSQDTVEVTADIEATLAIPNDSPPTWPSGTIENLAQAIPVKTNVSSSFGGYGPEQAIDGDPNTSWFAAAGDAANLGKAPFYEVVFPFDLTVSQIQMRGNHGAPLRYDFFKGRLELFDAAGTVLFSQEVDLPKPYRDIDLDIPDQANVRRVRFTGLDDKSNKPGFGEINILGPAPPALAQINTTLSGTVPVSLFIKNESGKIVRELVVDETRTGGSYTDFWDGTDDQGNLLPQGVYFAILEYPFAEEIRRVDLTHSTGWERYVPSRSELPNNFNPFQGNFLKVDFTVPADQGASEIQAFVGLLDPGTPFMTLLERVPFGTGPHTIYWDGFKPDGDLAVPPPDDGFFVSMFGFTLPDNAIFLQVAPHLSNVRVEPNFLDPSTPDFISPDNSSATVMYDLNKQADVELRIVNLKTGQVMRRIRQEDVPAGKDRTIQWNGRAENGVFVDKGNYRLALQVVDSTGSASLTQFALVRVFH